MNFNIPSENNLIKKYCGQSLEVSQSVVITQGWEEWLPKNVCEFCEAQVCTDLFYNF